MLLIARKKGQRVHILPNVAIEIVKCRGGWVTLGFTAPSEVKILRDELMTPAGPPVPDVLTSEPPF